ncbi:MAG: type II toxin-antitoxin system ParD family antitoxin [Rhizobiaceae bacterium]|nr:type II toxin-antitoxin system ParD family antitoxin [Rhizobiaceae bacterium]
MISDSDKKLLAVSNETMRRLRESVETGEFATADAALDDAIEVWSAHRAAVKDRLDEIRSRLHRSVDDPRPSLSADEAETAMASFMAAGGRASGDAAA